MTPLLAADFTPHQWSAMLGLMTYVFITYMPVVLPLTDEAMQHIAQGDVTARTEVVVLPINDFGLLWQCGLFQKLNLACGTAIGDYESAWIETDQLPQALRVVAEFSRVGHSAEVQEFLFRLSRLIMRAQEVAMPIYLEC